MDKITDVTEYDYKPKHEHKFFAYEVKPVYEPQPYAPGQEPYYRLVWVTFSSCNCGKSHVDRSYAEPEIQ